MLSILKGETTLEASTCACKKPMKKDRLIQINQELGDLIVNKRVCCLGNCENYGMYLHSPENCQKYLCHKTLKEYIAYI